MCSDIAMPIHNTVYAKALSAFTEHNEGKRVFLEHEVKGFLEGLGLPVPRGIVVKKGSDMPSVHHLIYPLAVKIVSAGITSKSDVHGVKLGINTSEELKETVSGLMRIEYAEGVLIEEMASEGLEVIIGGTIDKQFGPVVMFGLGGIFVELFKDVAFGVAPLKYEEALWLIRQVKGYRLLEGYRGKPPVNIKTLLNIIITVSELMATGLLEEIDLNPLILYPQGAMIADAKMLVVS